MLAARPGPEEIVELADPRARLTAFLVIDSTRLGPAFGGIRVRAYREERDALLDALDLAAAMTLKAALAGLRCGGGKIVVIDRPGLRRGAAIDAVGGLLRGLRGRFFAGPDLGATAADLRRLRRITRYAAAEPSRGEGSLGDATARGTVAAIEAALAFGAGISRGRGPRARGRAGGRWGTLGRRPTAGTPGAAAGSRRGGGALESARVAVQGLGAVGLPLVRRLLEAGASVVAADPDPRAAARGRALGARIVSPARLIALESDVFAPAAAGRLVDAAFARRCGARIVCGPANNQLASPDVEEILARRGLVFVPDILVGAGALVAGALRHLDGVTEPGPAIDRIGGRVARLLAESRRTGRLATETAQRIADRRLRRGA
jgi:leucine dehydrogenase